SKGGVDVPRSHDHSHVMANRTSRRSILGSAVAMTGAAVARPSRPAPPAVPHPPPRNTRQSISLIGIGGAHMGSQADEQESIRIVRHALDSGITFLDNCWDYNGGKSEERMGKALAGGYRQKAFLMTKLDGRTKDAAAQQLEQSLRRL